MARQAVTRLTRNSSPAAQVKQQKPERISTAADDLLAAA
jgi:hypothetical protein